MKLDNIDFKEEYADTERDTSGIIDRKVFKYRNRESISTPE